MTCGPSFISVQHSNVARSHVQRLRRGSNSRMKIATARAVMRNALRRVSGTLRVPGISVPL
jgi:hypothetical protein